MIQEYKEFLARKCEELRMHDDVSAGSMTRNVISHFISREKRIWFLFTVVICTELIPPI